MFCIRIGGEASIQLDLRKICAIIFLHSVYLSQVTFDQYTLSCENMQKQVKALQTNRFGTYRLRKRGTFHENVVNANK